MNMCILQDFKTFLIPYKNHQLAELNSQDGKVYSLSIFGNNEFLEINSKNILTSLLQIADFIYNRKLKNNIEDDIPALTRFSQAAQSFISSIYKVEWDSLKTNNLNKIFRQNITSKFTPKIISKKSNKRVKLTIKEKQAEVVIRLECYDLKTFQRGSRKGILK